MNKPFYRVWLPASLAVHLALVLLFAFVNITVQAEEPPDYGLISVVAFAEPLPVTRPVEAIPPEARPEVAIPMPGVPHPRTDAGNGISEKVNPSPGPGEKPTVAPALMTSPTGKIEVPVGQPGGLGTEAEGDLGPSGPSYGASVTGTEMPTYPKLAMEKGEEGTVIVRVTVGEDGTIEGTAVAASSTHESLDRAALRAARAWRFKPAMETGRMVSSTVRLSFRFKDGKVEGNALP